MRGEGVEGNERESDKRREARGKIQEKENKINKLIKINQLITIHYLKKSCFRTACFGRKISNTRD
jgi:hypothetical protein